MLLKFLPLLAAVGIVAGFLSGLLGIGGGIIMVPLLFWVLPECGVSQSVYVHVAIATSLAAACCFTFSGAIAHYKKGKINWKWVPWLCAGGITGALIGSYVASHLSGKLIKKLFAFLLAYASYRISFPNDTTHISGVFENTSLFVFIGFITGFISSFFGVGGGIVAVPMMVLVFKFQPVIAVATSSAIIPVIAGIGALSYVFHGWGNPQLPQYSIGYVNIAAWGFLVPTGLIASQIGARISHRIKGVYLRRIFGILLFIVSIKLLAK